MEGRKEGWMEGRESGVKDCLQQSKKTIRFCFSIFGKTDFCMVISDEGRFFNTQHAGIFEKSNFFTMYMLSRKTLLWKCLTKISSESGKSLYTSCSPWSITSSFHSPLLKSLFFQRTTHAELSYLSDRYILGNCHYMRVCLKSETNIIHYYL